MNFVFTFLCVVVVVVHCKPVVEVDDAKTDSGSDKFYGKITGSINSLKSQIATLKDALKKHGNRKADAKPKKEVQEVNSLLADLEKAVADDRKQDEKASKGVPDLKETKKFPVKDNEKSQFDELFGKDDDLDPNNDVFEDEDELLKYFDDDEVTPSETKAEIVVPKIDAVAKDTVQKVKEQEETKNEKKDQVKNMKDAVIGIRSDLHRIKKAFTEMKKDYTSIVKDHPLDAISKDKFESIRSVMDNVIGEFKGLKTQLAVSKSDETQDESTSKGLKDDTIPLLTDMKDQLQKVSDTINELEKAVNNKKDDTSENKAKDEEKQKEIEDEKQNEHRDVKDEILGIRSDFHRIKKAFSEIKKDYSSIVKDHALDETSREKFKSIRTAMHTVVDEFKDINGQLTDSKGNEMKDETTSRHTNDETMSLLADIKVQLADTSNTIQELRNEEKREPMATEKKKTLNDVKDAVLNIRSNFHRISKAFTEVKKDYSAIAKDHTLDKTSQNMLISIKSAMDNLVEEFKGLKAELTVSKRNTMQDKSISEYLHDETMSLVAKMNDQLNQVSGTIQKLHDLSKAKDKEDIEMAMEMNKVNNEKKEGELNIAMEKKDNEEKEKKQIEKREKDVIGKEKVEDGVEDIEMAMEMHKVNNEKKETELNFAMEQKDNEEKEKKQAEKREKDVIGKKKVEDPDVEIEMAIEMEKQKQGEKEMEIKMEKKSAAKHVQDTKNTRSESKKPRTDEEDMAKLNVMKDEVKKVIITMKKIKEDIEKRKSTVERHRLENVKKQIEGIKEKMENLKKSRETI